MKKREEKEREERCSSAICLILCYEAVSILCYEAASILCYETLSILCYEAFSKRHDSYSAISISYAHFFLVFNIRYDALYSRLSRQYGGSYIHIHIHIYIVYGGSYIHVYIYTYI